MVVQLECALGVMILTGEGRCQKHKVQNETCTRDNFVTGVGDQRYTDNTGPEMVGLPTDFSYFDYIDFLFSF